MCILKSNSETSSNSLVSSDLPSESGILFVNDFGSLQIYFCDCWKCQCHCSSLFGEEPTDFWLLQPLQGCFGCRIVAGLRNAFFFACLLMSQVSTTKIFLGHLSTSDVLGQNLHSRCEGTINRYTQFRMRITFTTVLVVLLVFRVLFLGGHWCGTPICAFRKNSSRF